MHDYSPLKSLELRAIDDCLNAGDLEGAQQQLGQLTGHSDLQPGTTYLATRLLFLRGRLDAASVVERMRELVGANPQFFEARDLMSHCLDLLRASGSTPPPGATPRPGSLFPSSPPSQPAADPAPDTMVPGDDHSLAPETLSQRTSAWPQEAFEATELHDSDRPTFEPEQDWLLGLDRASLAQTEFPAALESDAPSDPSVPTREIRVDTRQSIIPTSGSLPPPSLYNPALPRPLGRYSLRNERRADSEPAPESTAVGTGSSKPSAPGGSERGLSPVVQRLSSPQPSDSAALSGRYRMSNVSSDVVPIPLVSGKTRATKASAGSSPRQQVPRPTPPPASTPQPDLQSNPNPADGLEDRPTPFRVPRPDLNGPPSSQNGPASYGWNDPERHFSRGDTHVARARFEQRALEVLEPYPESFADFEARTVELCALLSTAPVVHYFAPFDGSLCSLSRLELALRTLYGSTAALPVGSIRPLVAMYLGEVLRASHRGTWRGVPGRPSTWAVEAGAHIWQPFRCAAQILDGTPGQAALSSIGAGLAKRGTVAWMSRLPSSTPLPKPWLDPLTPQKQAELGQLVRTSPWSVCCLQLFGHALDGTPQSLKALDQLLDVLCDSSEAPRPLDLWLTRAATLAGAYVGVVLGDSQEATWVERESASGERYLAVELPGGLLATPIANVITRATSRKRSQLSDYVRALLRRAR